jgi:hypothetical protein
MMDCSVEPVCIVPAALAAVAEHRYWLLAAAYGMELHDVLNPAGNRLLPAGDMFSKTTTARGTGQVVAGGGLPSR